MKATWVDAHCHLADPKIESELPAIVARSRAQGVQVWVQGGVEPGDWSRQLLLVEQFGLGIVPAFGLHPWWVATHSRSEVERALGTLEQQVVHAQALGELGLDFADKFSPEQTSELQSFAFGAQLAMALKHRKPLVLHVVKAHSEAIALLKAKALSPYRGIVHSFSAGWEVAREYLDLGLSLSISGAITRPGYKALKSCLANIPADRLLIETDAPDQSPILGNGHRPLLNEPAHLIAIARVLADYRGLDYETLLDQSALNLHKLFRISV